MMVERDSDQQRPRQNTPNHARLDHANFTLTQGRDTDLKYRISLESIPKTKGGTLTIISTALPKVALISPPTVGPTLADSSSVAKESKLASGKMARKLRIKTVAEFHSKVPAMMPRGTNPRKTFDRLEPKVTLMA